MFDNLAKINEDKADRDLSATRHQEVLAHNDNVAATVLSATSSLIKYLEGHTTKTEIINQPIADLSSVKALLEELLHETKNLPNMFPSPVEFPQPIDNTKQLNSLKDAVQAVEKVVKAQKLIAEAPVVNVPETTVNVEAPDLKPLQSGFKDVIKAVKLSTDDMKEATAKTQAGLITERFDEYKIKYASYSLDDSDEKMISGITYHYKGKRVAELKYTYKGGKLVGGKRV